MRHLTAFSGAEFLDRTARLLEKGDFESALALLQATDLANQKPIDAVKGHVLMGRCLSALGRHGESVAQHRTALSVFFANNLLTNDTANRALVDFTMNIAIGACDADIVTRLMRIKYPHFFSVAREMKVSPLKELRSWCREQGIDVEGIDPARKIAIRDEGGTGRAFSYHCEETWYATLPNAEVISGWDFVMSPVGDVLEGANYSPAEIGFAFMPHAYYPAAGLIAHVWPSDAVFVDADALYLSTPASHHFGHWIANFLPRLRAWRRSGPSPRKLAISSSLPRKHRELLACFGVTSDDVIECGLGQRYKFRSLCVVKTASSATPNPDDVKFLYQHFRPRSDRAPANAAKQLLFLERDRGTRIPFNQTELDEVFAEFGVIKVNPAKLSYAEQAALLANTSIIIGAFGTELYCALNMHVGSTVIELIWDSDRATVYGPICSFLGMNHHLIVCKGVEGTQSNRRKTDRDLIVDCGELRQRLSASVEKAGGLAR